MTGVQTCALPILQHVAPNNVAICWVGMLRSFGRGFKLNLLQHTRQTVRQQIWLTCCCWFVLPYASMFSPDVCHQKLLEIVHKEEVKVKWILSAKVEVLNSEKGPRDRYKLMGTRHFTPFKKDARKGARTERTWYLIWKAADRCLLKVGHSECCCSDAVAAVGRSSFLCKSFRNTFKVNLVSKVTSRKNQIS